MSGRARVVEFSLYNENICRTVLIVHTHHTHSRCTCLYGDLGGRGGTPVQGGARAPVLKWNRLAPARTLDSDVNKLLLWVAR